MPLIIRNSAAAAASVTSSFRRFVSLVECMCELVSCLPLCRLLMMDTNEDDDDDDDEGALPAHMAPALSPALS